MPVYPAAKAIERSGRKRPSAATPECGKEAVVKPERYYSSISQLHVSYKLTSDLCCTLT